jgi:two-component system chemotaxis sensor kinase CheA
MQPVGRLFQKFPRLVRELAKDLGKDVDLNIDRCGDRSRPRGGGQLYDPLVHMLRNSLDHGVEAGPRRRRQVNKSTISLKLAGSATRHDRSVR